jgi:hypothetical protein
MSTLRLTPERYAELQKKACKGAKTGPGRDFPASGVRPPTKYRNRATGGYASVREANRAGELKLLVASGAITELRQQVPFELIPAQRDEAGKLLEHACTYVADFTYNYGGALVVEDAKGFETKDYVIKRKLMLWVHAIKVVAV